MALGLGISNRRGYKPIDDFSPALTSAAILSAIDTMIAALGAAAGLSPVQYAAKCTPSVYSLWSNWTGSGSVSAGHAAINHLPPYQGFPQITLLDGLRDRGIVPQFFVSPATSSNPGGDGTWFDLAKITDGSWDTYLNSWFDLAAAWAAQPNATGYAKNCQPKTSTMLYRFAWEMNPTYDGVTWAFPWLTGGGSPNTAAEYKAAFQYIANKRTARGATNVKMVWCPWGQPGSTSNFSTFYPGASYVDYLAFDAYSSGGTMQKIYSEAISALNALTGASSLPIIISETGIATNVTSDAEAAAWLRNGIEYVANHWPKVRALVYFDLGSYSFYDEPPNSPNTATLAAFANAMVANTQRIA